VVEETIKANTPPLDRIEPWHWRPNLRALPTSFEPQSVADDVEHSEQFDLDTHWRRGGLRESLFAPSDAMSEVRLDAIISGGLFVLPQTTARGVAIEKSQFLKLLARYNGCPLEALRGALRWDKATFRSVIDNLLSRDLIFTVPYEPLIADRSDLYYLRDTGLLHRLFNPKWARSRSGVQHWARSWEGFAIQTIMFGPGEGAAAAVWRKGDDEIDLILQWPGAGERWAIEIGMGTDKRPSPGFWRGVNLIDPSRKLIVHRGVCDILGECERMTLEHLLSA
jgi:predicted AAA+ superfamily ATPase